MHNLVVRHFLELRGRDGYRFGFVHSAPTTSFLCMKHVDAGLRPHSLYIALRHGCAYVASAAVSNGFSSTSVGVKTHANNNNMRKEEHDTGPILLQADFQ